MPVGSEIDLELRLESVVEGVLVSGSVHVLADGECARCLDPLDRELVVELQELYVYPVTRTGTRTHGRSSRTG